jgi:MoxR-like ATPase
MERVLYEVKKIIVGQDHLLERLIVALLARGHILVEGVPGLAKTMAIKTLADSIGGEFKRIQFTPDLVPADLIGTRIYNITKRQASSTRRLGLCLQIYC